MLSDMKSWLRIVEFNVDYKLLVFLYSYHDYCSGNYALKVIIYILKHLCIRKNIYKQSLHE